MWKGGPTSQPCAIRVHLLRGARIHMTRGLTRLWSLATSTRASHAPQPAATITATSAAAFTSSSGSCSSSPPLVAERGETAYEDEGQAKEVGEGHHATMRVRAAMQIRVHGGTSPGPQLCESD